MRWSSISFASLRASSTGWTWVRNARPKTPSKSASIFCSMFRSTVTGGVLPRRRVYRASAWLNRPCATARGHRGPPAALSLSRKSARVCARTVPKRASLASALRKPSRLHGQREIRDQPGKDEGKRSGLPGRRAACPREAGPRRPRSRGRLDASQTGARRPPRRGSAPRFPARGSTEPLPERSATPSGCSLPAIPSGGSRLPPAERDDRPVDAGDDGPRQHRGERMRRAPHRPGHVQDRERHDPQRRSERERSALRRGARAARRPR